MSPLQRVLEVTRLFWECMTTSLPFPRLRSVAPSSLQALLLLWVAEASRTLCSEWLLTSTRAERHCVSPLTPRNQVFQGHTWLLGSFSPGSAGIWNGRPLCVFRMDTSIGIEVNLQTCPHETTPAFGTRTCCSSYSLFRIISRVRNNDVSLYILSL